MCCIVIVQWPSWLKSSLSPPIAEAMPPDVTLPLRRDFALEMCAGRKEFEARDGSQIGFHWYNRDRVMATVVAVFKFDSC